MRKVLALSLGVMLVAGAAFAQAEAPVDARGPDLKFELQHGLLTQSEQADLKARLAREKEAKRAKQAAATVERHHRRSSANALPASEGLATLQQAVWKDLRQIQCIPLSAGPDVYS